MPVNDVLFWIAVAILGWLGLRNLFSIFTGLSQTGPLKPGQRLCHLTSLCLYWGACAYAVLYDLWWPLGMGFVLELLFRKAIVRSGNEVYRRELGMLFAVRTNDMEALKRWIEEGADVNWQDSRVDGATALHEAVRKGSMDMMRFLLHSGAKIDLGNHNGLTPLHVAAFLGNVRLVRALIEEGAEINTRARDGITPLHSAAAGITGDIETVELLVKEGAEINARSSTDGSTPKDFALRHGREAIVDLLSRY